MKKLVALFLVLCLAFSSVAFAAEDEPFVRPAWLGAEVSDDHRYCNTSLSKHPYKEWEK